MKRRVKEIMQEEMDFYSRDNTEELMEIIKCIETPSIKTINCVEQAWYSLSRILRTLAWSTTINLLGARPQLVRGWSKRPLPISEKINVVRFLTLTTISWLCCNGDSFIIIIIINNIIIIIIIILFIYFI